MTIKEKKSLLEYIRTGGVNIEKRIKAVEISIESHAVSIKTMEANVKKFPLHEAVPFWKKRIAEHKKSSARLNDLLEVMKSELDKRLERGQNKEKTQNS